MMGGEGFLRLERRLDGLGDVIKSRLAFPSEHERGEQHHYRLTSGR